MKTKQRVLPALLLSLFAAAAAPAAHAQQFSGVFVFGDSLSDAGYFRPFLASLGLPATVVATLGRFTTNPGPSWSELVSLHYGVTPAPSNVAGGNIYAQGGARVTLPSASTPPGGAQRPVSTQIDEYLAANGGAADPNALFTVWAGGNDFLQNFALLQAGQITSAQLQTNVLGAVTAEVGQVGRLLAAGARNIVVFGGYDPAAAPAFAGADPASRAGATALAVGANTTLFSGLASAGLHVIPVDFFTLFNELRATPAAYGFTNITGIACGPFPPITTSGNAQFCLSTNLVAPNADQTYLFADSVHLTTHTNAIIAQFVEALIDGPTAYSLLAETPLRTSAGHMRSVSDALATSRKGEGGRISVFAAADGGHFDIDPSFGLGGVKSTNKSLSVGVMTRASETVTLGIAAGKAKSDASFGQDMGGFRTNESIFSLFGSAQWCGFYANGIVSLSDIKFGNVQRNIALGPLVRTASANPEGSNASAHFSLGYDLELGRLLIGPTISVTSQNVDVNAFDEADAGSANLHISSQRRRSEVWSAGVRASLDLHGWTPWVRITADKERKDQARFVTASPLSLAATGNTYDIAAYAPDTTFMTGAIGINGVVMERIGLSLAYYKVSGRSGIKEDGVSGMLSYRF